MKYIQIALFIIAFSVMACSTGEQKDKATTESKSSVSEDSKEQIQNLMRNALFWTDTNKTVDLLPTIADAKDSLYIGFDLKQHKQNMEKLKASHFFAKEFIDNFNQIIETLDQKLRNKEIEPWLVGDLPSFRFANDVNPWCECQDIPYDQPNPWNLIEIEMSDIPKGEGIWKWGKLEGNTDTSWKNFAYKFRVVKEEEQWKIAYLQGFDFKESIQTEGQESII
jgi:hypothetical protein